MSENLRRQMPKLQLVCETKPIKTRLELLRILSLDENFNKAVREIVRNAVKKNIPFSDGDKKKLVKYRACLLALARAGKKGKRKTRKYICQTGTGIFLPLAIPLVAEIIRSFT